MTNVIKSTGQKEPFRPEKIRRSLESAVKDAGFNPRDKQQAIEHASGDVMQLAKGKDQVETKQIRNAIINDLEQDEPQVAQAWKKYERQHGMNY